VYRQWSNVGPMRPDEVCCMHLHHIGYVVESIEKAMPGFLRSLGARWDGQIFEDPHQKVKVAFLATHPQDAQIELVEPAAGDSPITKFLQNRGGGLHHCCYEVENLQDGISAMRKQGALLAKPPKPAVAFHGRLIAWLITPEKLLVELLQKGTET
jgi:methylmalonyl-CoA/ethylmalonyl-CoA epimerase